MMHRVCFAKTVALKFKKMLPFAPNVVRWYQIKVQITKALKMTH